MRASVAREVWRRISLEEATPRSALEAAAAIAHEALGARWTAALQLFDDEPARVLASLGAAPPQSALIERAQAFGSPSPAQHDADGLRAVSVGLWPHGTAAAAIVCGLAPDADAQAALAFLRDAQGEAEAAWDLAEQAVTLRERAPSAQELATLRERVLQRLWHELLTPVALLRAAHEQLRAQETDEAKKKPLARIGKATERLGHLFDLLNDILWAREAVPMRRSAVQLGEALVASAGAQLLIELAHAGLARDDDAITAASMRLVDHVHALAPLVDETAAPVDVPATLKGVMARVAATAEGRALQVTLDAAGREQLPARLFEDAAQVLLKNAYANTPDGSLVEVRARRGPDGLSLEVKDHGVGIAQDRLRILLAGLNEARDPTWYSTGKPFAFGAGGAGLDLVRLQAMGGWRGWRIEAESAVCPHLDADGRGCPGKAADCKHLQSPDECAALEKGTLVRIRIP